jgi:hypothetical protein
MVIDLSDSRGDFAIDVVGKEVEEIDVLRLAAEAGSRAATFIKTALGHDAMMQLIAGQARATTERWQEYLRESDGAYLVRSTRYRVSGLELDAFWSFFEENSGQALQFAMHPEHYVSSFSDGLGGRAVIGEPWGSAMILSHATFTEPDAMRDLGLDVDALLEPDATRRVCAVGRAEDGTFLCAVLHQLVPHDGGFEFKTGSFLPATVPADVLEGIEAHGLLEFTTLLRVARDAVVGGHR